MSILRLAGGNLPLVAAVHQTFNQKRCGRLASFVCVLKYEWGGQMRPANSGALYPSFSCFVRHMGCKLSLPLTPTSRW